MAIYEPVIHRVATGTGLQHADALDVVQEVFAKVHRTIDDWDSDRKDGRFRNWIHRLTVNASIDVIRRHKRQVIASGHPAVHALLEQEVDSQDESTLFRLEYRRALFTHAANRVRDGATEKAWNAFWLTAVEQRQPTKVAEELGLSVGAVYAHRCRILSRIRGCVQQLSTDVSIEIEAQK